MTYYQNPSTNAVRIGVTPISWLWVILVPAFYFLAKGIWQPILAQFAILFGILFIASVVVGASGGGILNLVVQIAYIIYLITKHKDIVDKGLKSKGWVPISAEEYHERMKQPPL